MKFLKLTIMENEFYKEINKSDYINFTSKNLADIFEKIFI